MCPAAIVHSRRPVEECCVTVVSTSPELPDLGRSQPTSARGPSVANTASHALSQSGLSEPRNPVQHGIESVLASTLAWSWMLSPVSCLTKLPVSRSWCLVPGGWGGRPVGVCGGARSRCRHRIAGACDWSADGADERQGRFLARFFPIGVHGAEPGSPSTPGGSRRWPSAR